MQGEGGVAGVEAGGGTGGVGTGCVVDEAHVLGVCFVARYEGYFGFVGSFGWEIGVGEREKRQGKIC